MCCWSAAATPCTCAIGCAKDLPENTMQDAERWAAMLGVPAYALDDQSAIKVVDGVIEVVSEGHWRKFKAYPSRALSQPSFEDETPRVRWSGICWCWGLCLNAAAKTLWQSAW
jgi:hypothetical protein